jgi:hypothetical protein
VIGVGGTVRRIATITLTRGVYVGRARPFGTRNVWHDRQHWRVHLAPITAARWGDQWAAGLCVGARCVYVHSLPAVPGPWWPPRTPQNPREETC